jgi:hypothetical protein
VNLQLQAALTLAVAGSILLQKFTAVFPNYAVSAMFAVQFGVIADYTLCQALFTVAILALVARKNTLSIRMKSAIILGYHGGCRVLKKMLCVKDRAHFARRMGHRAWSTEYKILTPLSLCSMLAAKSGPICKTNSVNLFIISPKQVNWKNHYTTN